MVNKLKNNKVLLLFNPFDIWGDVGCEEGVRRLYDRIMYYLSIKDARIDTYRFFDFQNVFKTKFFPLKNVRMYSQFERSVRTKLFEIINSATKFFYFGGNHLSVLPILECYNKVNFKTLFCIFDSHIDASALSLSGNKSKSYDMLNFSNYLSPFMGMNSPISFIHIGSKHPIKNEVLHNHNLHIITVQDILLHEGENYIYKRLDNIISRLNVDALHIDIDLDVLDHSIMKAVFDPCSFGISLHCLLKIIRHIINKLPLLGIDIVGYNRRIDPHIEYEEVCLRLFENLVYLISESKINRELWFGKK